MGRKFVLLVLAVLLLSGCVQEHAKPPVKPDKKLPKPPKTQLPEKEGRTFKGRWVQLAGLDGGDMHMIDSANDMLFVSHGFSGVWWSEDGKNWKIVDSFVDVHFYDVLEWNGKIYAASNKGIWRSDDGKNWQKVSTVQEVDEGKYLVTSLAVYDNKLFFTAVLDKPYRKGEFGEGRLFYLENGKTVEFEAPAKDEIVVVARDPYLFLSSRNSGLYVYDGKWERILSTGTAWVHVDENYNLYVGTFEDYYYIGRFNSESWEFKHVVLKVDPSNTIFYFIKPDPVNSNRLWFGSGGISSFYSFHGRGKASAFVGVGCWDGSRLYDVTLNPNYGMSLVFYGSDTVDTACGKATKQAFVTQGGGNSVMVTEDGGRTWKRSYDGIYGDTINAVNVISSGIHSGSIVITAVSGIEIATNHSDSWLGVDFTIGKVGGKLPGYSWCAASPEEKIKGKYDLLISTGYPSPFKGDGVFAVDVSCLLAGGKECIEKLIDGPFYEMAILDGKLYAGSMDSGVAVLDLTTFSQSTMDFGSAAPLVRVFDGELYVGTYNGKFTGDSWRWEGSSGKVYRCSGKCEVVYDGYAVSFSVSKGEFLALSKDGAGYKLVYKSGTAEKVVRLEGVFTDMVVDWKSGVVFLSTYGDGVFYTTIDDVKRGSITLRPINDGLLTLKIRNLAYDGKYVFAGTQGCSVWRLEIQKV